MHLLNLPPELLQSVFDYSSVTNCLQAAYACHTLFAVLSNYRKGLLYQLSQLPSPRSNSLSTVNASDNGSSSSSSSNDNDNDLSSKCTADLYLLLRRRAAQNLCGANFHANLSIYTFGEGALIIDTLASTIRQAHGEDPNVALVQKGASRVYLYSVKGGQVVPRGVLEPVVVWPGKVEVIKVVFGEEGNVISVLQRFTPLPEEDGVDENKTANGNGNGDGDGDGDGDGVSGSKHIFEEEAMKPYRKESTQLVHYRRSKPGSRYSRVTISVFPGQNEYRPLAIAVADRHLVAISWQHKQHLDRRMVIVHAAYPDTATEDMKIAYQVYNDNTIIDEDGTMPYDNRYQRPRNTGSIDPIIQMSFNDNATQLLYYHPSSTIYGHFQRIELEYGSTTTTSGLIRNSCWVKYYNSDHNASDLDDAVKFTIAIPFFSTHETRSHDPNHELCYWKYLALGTATDKHGELIACILMSEAHCRSFNCQHIENLDRGRRLDNWRVVARLAGYSTSVSSLPGIVAASRQATRLAIANWKTITVWPMDPHAIIERNATGVYPENMIDVDVTGAVLLEPVVLESEAVCFMLRFAEGEDEIISLTDRGVMRWDISAGAVGRREVSVLGIAEKSGADEVESEVGGGERDGEGVGMDVDMNEDEDEQDHDVDVDVDEDEDDDESDTDMTGREE
ncbi:hypothetical protein ACJ72_07829 [Emergomyces africanus]|uniref:F-box domain-containing protein n=1 Tax=Emergomyces africanus TaxID=1955775 RepID=A0A1B7NML3_9EURO|nr:hypothetical protein ACJ72_07829 [Emergomyces africanus]